MLSIRVVAEPLPAGFTSPCQLPATLVKPAPPDVVALSPLVHAVIDSEQMNRKKSPILVFGVGIYVYNAISITKIPVVGE